MNKQLLTLFSILVLISLSCTISVPVPTLEPGETKTFSISEAATTSDISNVAVQMSAGKLNISGGAQNLVEGTIQYNIPGWQPETTRIGDNITISQKTQLGLNIPSDKLLNKWDLKLGARPMKLDINASAYKGDFNLTNVPLKNLKINSSASESQVIFENQNPQSMEQLEFSTSASNVELSGLGYANFASMNFNASAGNYTLDFSGSLQQPAQAIITGGGCNIKMIIPKGTTSKIEVTGPLSGVAITTGTWTVNDGIYSTDGTSPLLNVKVQMGAGRLELIQK